MRSFFLCFSVLFISFTGFSQSADKEGEPVTNRNGVPSFKWIRTIHEQTIRPYSDGLAAFFEAGKWGFEDVSGTIVIPAVYEEAGDFAYGVARVRKEGKWGVIDRNGKEVFPCEYDVIEPFSDNTALAKKGDVSYYIYLDGRPVLKLPSDLEFYSYSSGVAKVKKGGKFGYIDNRKGYFTVEPSFDEASDFYGEYAVVRKGDNSYIINKKGRRFTVDFPITTENTSLSSGEGSGFINRDGHYIFLKSGKGSFSVYPYNFTKVQPFREELAFVESSSGLKFIRPDGTTSISLRDYDGAGNFSEGMAWVASNGKYGYIDNAGNLVIDTIFSYASDFRNGYAFVAYKGKKGIIKKASVNDRYPVLRIDDVRFRDMNSNGKVETDERFQIDVTLRNTGNETLRNVQVVLSGKAGQASWFDYDRTMQVVNSIEAGKSATVTFIGIANSKLISEDILVNIKAEADNLMLAEAASMDFQASGINQCKPLLASYWVHTEDHTPLVEGKKAVVEIEVKNDGTDMAKDVVISLRWPAGVIAETDKMHVGDIQPGETRKTMVPFNISDTLAGTTTYSVVATLTDFTKNHSDVKYLSFESGKMNYAVNLMTGMISGYVTPSAQYAANLPGVAVEQPLQDEINEVSPSGSELLAGLTMLKAPDSNKYALIIGNEDYNSFKQEALYEPNVDFAVQDARTFSEYAKNILGIPEKNIVLLENATYSQMNLNINKLARIAKVNPDKVELYVFYAGHGQVDADSKESYLIPVDVSTTSPAEGIKLERMYATLSESRAKRTLVFLDACYSGVGRGIVIQPKETPVKGNLVIMTASSATQRSMPYQEKEHGMFTYFLLKELKDKQGNITIEQLYQSVKSSVQTNSVWINNMEQTPELISGPGIASDWKQWQL